MVQGHLAVGLACIRGTTHEAADLQAGIGDWYR